MRKYTRDHEWLDVDGDTVTVGISEFAAQQLGDVVFLELPNIGASFSAGQAAATVESVKAASEIYSPVAGTVVDVNNALVDAPDLINKSPSDEGWLFRMKLDKPSDLENLLDEAAYKALTTDQN